MDSNSIKKSAILMLVIVTIALVSWEIRLRNIGVTATYDSGNALWSDKRAMIYEPKDKVTVFIGSSRMKYDIDIPTWETLTAGNQVIQLAQDGSNPIPVLLNLADDEKFKGRLLIDITEGLFFSMSPFYKLEPNKNMKYYKDRTYAQKASFEIDKILQSQLVFLDKDNFSLNTYLDELELKSRPKVFVMPIWPWQFGRISFGNQEYMNEEFIRDTNLQVRVRNIWAGFAKMPTEPAVSGKPLDSIMNVVKTATNKIKARGGEVFFTRTPSSGPYLMGEEHDYPRDKYFNRILDETQTQGFHFKDYPSTQNMICPEWSHLAPSDAVAFTKELVKVLKEEKGWKF